MSIINEALKKAQRIRAEDAADVSAASYSGGTHVPRRGKPDSTNTMVLIGSGALVLVVLSVVFTVYLVNRPATPTQVAAVTPAPVVKKATSAPVSNESATASAIVAPAITVPTFTPPAKNPASSTTGATSTPASSAPVPSTATAQPVTTATPPATTATATPAPGPTAPTLAPGVPDERIAAFVESVRVTGIRTTGTESRVLMNERVYRVNDVVERTMSIRLVKTAPDSLTFADSRGVTYVKRL